MAAPCGFSIGTEKLYDGQLPTELTNPLGFSIFVVF
jgi:hypothetical protein